MGSKGGEIGVVVGSRLCVMRRVGTGAGFGERCLRERSRRGSLKFL